MSDHLVWLCPEGLVPFVAVWPGLWPEEPASQPLDLADPDEEC